MEKVLKISTKDPLATLSISKDSSLLFFENIADNLDFNKVTNMYGRIITQKGFIKA